MSDQYTEQNDFNTAVPTKTVVWIYVLIVVIILVVIGITIWAIIPPTKTKTPDNNNNIPTALNITGAQFKVLSSTSIGATWSSVSDPNDFVILYVNPSGQSLSFTKAGNPLGSKYFSSGPIPSTQNSASVSNLITGTTYSAYLVVTNTNYPGISNTGTTSSCLVVAPNTVPSKFSINQACQSGNIRYYSNTGSTNNPTMVAYTTNDSTTNGTLFHQDADGYICASNQNSTITACDNGSYILYANPTTNYVSIGQRGVLSGATGLGSTGAVATAAKWKYNTSGQNGWCLSNGLCMSYSNTNPIIPGPTGSMGQTGPTGTIYQQILLTSNSPPTSWANQGVSS